MDDFKARLNQFLGLSEEEFAWRTREPSFSDLPSLDAFQSAFEAKLLFEKAKKEGCKTLIYGDYDCDGIMATSILLAALKEFGLNVEGYIPSRYKDGYGLTLEKAKKAVEEGYQLVCTVDNGVNAFEGLEYLHEHGVLTFVLDHHEFGEKLPPMDAFLHPFILELKEPSISAGALAFYFSRYLLGRDDPYFATLGALSIISDCMDMLSYNQKLVALSLRFIRKYRFPSLLSLMNPSSRIDETTLGLEIIPCINAVGRIEKEPFGPLVLPYFAFQKDIQVISKVLKEINAKRKELTKGAELGTDINPSKWAIALETSLPEGVNGLLANRLLFAYHKPVAVYSESEEAKDSFVGSMRSLKGFSVIDFYKSISDLLEKAGGHELAGGFTLKKERINEFKDALEDFALAHPMEEEKKKAMEISPDEIDFESFKAVRALGPYGLKNPVPEFLLSHYPVDQLRYSRDNQHILTYLENGNKLVGFHMPKEKLAPDTRTVSLQGKLGFDEYKGKRSIVFQIESLKEDPIEE